MDMFGDFTAYYFVPAELRRLWPKTRY